MNSTVVVGYDQSPSSQLALREAAGEAVWRDVPLTVVTAYAWSSSAALMARPPEVEAVVRKGAEETAEHGAALARSWHPGLRVETVAHPAHAWRALAELSESAELLVVGNRGRGGFAGLHLGSVSMRALSHARCPVLVARGGEFVSRGQVLAAVDLEEPGDEVLSFACGEASRRADHLKTVTVMDEPWGAAYFRPDSQLAHEFALLRHGRETDLADRVQRVEAGYPDVRTHNHVTVGSPGRNLVAESAHVDLVVVGAHRQAGHGRRLRIGPVAEVLLHHARCPVAVVPLD